MDLLRAFEDAMLCNDNYMQCEEINFMGISESLLGAIAHHWGCQYISTLGSLQYQRSMGIPIKICTGETMIPKIVDDSVGD